MRVRGLSRAEMDHLSGVSDAVWATFLLLALLVQLFAKRAHLPYTVLLVVTGIALTQLASRYPQPFHLLSAIEVSPQLILYLFLPTLIFESSYNLDARRLRHNLTAILTLAIPGLLISTLLIGLIVAWVTPLPLLLGAILSATDPVAVIALFRQLGAPQRFNTLVEGESLFNDATAIELSRILIAIIIAGSLSETSFRSSALNLLILFFGGLLVGGLLGYLASLMIGWVEAEPFFEIGLTTTLAYLSFLIAEELFHVSGVIATVAAGVTLGSWGRIRISHSVQVYLDHFWEFIAMLATALLFLLVGMQVDLLALWAAVDILVWVVIAMLLARAVIIFGLMPLVGLLPGIKPASITYRTIMFWGGLRGAIALALSLPEFEQRELIIALVMGAVLFTLLVPGMTIKPRVHRLGLDNPPLADRMALLERRLLAQQRALGRLPLLKQSGRFSLRIIDQLRHQSNQTLRKTHAELQRLRREELDPPHEITLLFLRAMTEEKAFYAEMYTKGHLSEGGYRELLLVLTLQIDALRHYGRFAHVHSHRIKRALENAFYRLAEAFPAFNRIAERMRLGRISRDYEEIWGHYLATRQVLDYLDKMTVVESIPEMVVSPVRERYREWHLHASQQLQKISEQFPEFVTRMQERLGQRLFLLAEIEVTHEQAARSMLPKGITDTLEEKFAVRLAALRGQAVEAVNDDPDRLLQQVELFA